MHTTGIHVPMQSQPFVTFVGMCCLASHAKDCPVKVMTYTCSVEFMNTKTNVCTLVSYECAFEILIK